MTDDDDHGDDDAKPFRRRRRDGDGFTVEDRERLVKLESEMANLTKLLRSYTPLLRFVPVERIVFGVMALAGAGLISSTVYQWLSNHGPPALPPH
jgi:hypothetical protein